MSALTDKLRARLIARYRGSALERFLHWWRAELVALVPERWRERLVMGRERLLVVADEEEWRLYRDGGEDPGEIDRLRPQVEDPELFRERLPKLLSGFSDERPVTVLCLPGRDVLIKELSLPSAAEENLRQVLGYEMDRHTPFKADHVHFDYRITGRDAQSRTLGLQLVVVPKNRLTSAVEHAERFGLRLDSVDVIQDGGDPPATMGVNLLPREKRTQRSRFRARLNAALATAAVLLLGLLMWQSLSLKQQRVEALEARVAEARETAMEVARLRQELEQAVRSANFLVRKKERHPELVDVLLEVTRLLPDDTWLQRFQMDEGEVQLYGESSSASRLISVLGESPMLKQASFISPVTTNTQTGDERFNLKVTVVPPDERPEQQKEDDRAVAAGS